MNCLPTLTNRSIRRPNYRAGLSLLELIIVMMILVATSVIVLPLLNTKIVSSDGTEKSAPEITTESTLQVIRQAIVGEEGVMENLANHPDALPREISELVEEEAPDHVRMKAPELARFNPLIGIGWRGPYIVPTGKNEQGKPTVVDGWGREIVLQVDFDADGQVDSEESKYIRIVSAGPNGQIDTPSDSFNMQPGGNDDQQLTLSDCGDDLVMFLCVPDYRR